MHSPPGTVFDFVAAHHFENYPRWDPDVLGPDPVVTRCSPLTQPGSGWAKDRLGAWELLPTSSLDREPADAGGAELARRASAGAG